VTISSGVMAPRVETSTNNFSTTSLGSFTILFDDDNLNVRRSAF